VHYVLQPTSGNLALRPVRGPNETRARGPAASEGKGPDGVCRLDQIQAAAACLRDVSEGGTGRWRLLRCYWRERGGNIKSMPWHWSKNIPCLHHSSGVKSRHVVIGFPKLIEVNCILISSQPRIACLDRDQTPAGSRYIRYSFGTHSSCRCWVGRRGHLSQSVEREMTNSYSVIPFGQQQHGTCNHTILSFYFHATNSIPQ
jgi:hypothetical protein